MVFVGFGVFAFIGFLFGDARGFDRGIDEKRKIDGFWEEVGRRVK